MANPSTIARRLGKNGRCLKDLSFLRLSLIYLESAPVKLNKWNAQEVRVALDDLVARVPQRYLFPPVILILP